MPNQPRLRRSLITLLCAELCFSVVRGETGQSGERGESDLPAHYQLEQLQAWEGELVPAVEAWAGRSFKEIPKLRIVSSDDMEDLLVRDADHITALRDKGDGAPSGADFERSLDSWRAIVHEAHSLVGKYSITDQVIVVVPSTVDAAMRRHGWSASQMPGILKVILAHELTHALQDQEVNLSKSLAALPAEKDTMMAYAALMEGSAILAYRHIARELGLGEAAGLLDKAIAQAAAPPDVCAGFAQAFCGPDRTSLLWNTLANPPQTLGREFREYAAAHAPQPTNVYTQALDSMEQSWGQDCLRVARVDASAERAMQFFVSLGEERSNQIRDTIDHVYTRVCLHRAERHEQRLCSVTLYVLKDPAQSSVLMEAFPPVIEDLKKLHRFDGLGRDKGSHSKRFTLEGGHAIEVRMLKTDYGRGGGIAQTIAWCELDGSVVQVLTVNVELSDVELIAIFQAVSAALG